MVSNELKQKQKKAEKLYLQSRNDLMLNRMSVIFAAVVIGVIAMLIAGKNISNEVVFITKWLTPLLIVSGVAFAASVVLFVIRTKNKTNDSDKLFTKWNILGAGVVFFGAMLGYRFTFDASLIAVGFVCVGVLYLVYATFSKDFFIYSIMTALGLMLMKLREVEFYSSLGKAVGVLCGVLCIIIALCGIVLAVMLISGKGTALPGAKKIKIKVSGKAYPFIVGAVFMIAGGIVGFVSPVFVTYILTAMVAAYVIVAITYVLKMM